MKVNHSETNSFLDENQQDDIAITLIKEAIKYLEKKQHHDEKRDDKQGEDDQSLFQRFKRKKKEINLESPTKSKSSWKSIVKKWFGSTQKIVPPQVFDWKETFLTAFGVLITLLMLWMIDTIYKRSRDTTRGDGDTLINTITALPMGPIGALITLLYAVPSAPLCQPRNVLFGQTLALVVASGLAWIAGTIVGSDIPDTTVATTPLANAYFSLQQILTDIWIRQIMATTITIGAMCRLGIVHPPAGATSITGKFRLQSTVNTFKYRGFQPSLFSLQCLLFI